MDELQKLYDLLVREGKYTKSFDDFKNKWGSEQGYQDKVFEVVSRDGFYTKDKGSFLSKYGTPAEEVKKKEVVLPPSPNKNATELPLGIGSLEYAKPTKPVAPAKVVDETPKEKNYFGGDFGNFLTSMDAIQESVGGISGIGDVIDDIGRAIGSGFSQGAIVTPANKLMLSGKSASSEDVKKYIAAAKESEMIGPSDEMMKFRDIYEKEGKGVYGFIKGLAMSPGALPEIAISSFATMLNPTSAATAGGVVGGAAAYGALATPEFGGVGAVPAALGSLPYAMGAANVTLETGLTFGELLQEELKNKGLEFNEENVKKVLEDDKAVSSIRAKSVARGATIGFIDALTGRLAGKVGAKLVGNTAASKVKSGLAATGIEAAGGSTGEAAGRLVAGQEMDIAEIGLEGVGEAPMAPISIAAEVMKKPIFVVNNELVTESDVKEIIDNTPANELHKIKFDIRNDKAGYNDIIQDKIVTNSIREEVRQVNPDIDEETLNQIVDLEKQLQKIEGNKTQSGKDKAASIRSQIKTLQENVQEQTASQVPVQSGTGVSQEVAQGEPQAKLEDFTEEDKKDIQKIIKEEKRLIQERIDDTEYSLLRKEKENDLREIESNPFGYIQRKVKEYKENLGQDGEPMYPFSLGYYEDIDRSLKQIQQRTQAEPQVAQTEVAPKEVAPVIEMTEQQQDAEISRLNDKVFEAKKNIARASDTEAAIEQYNAAKKELEDFEASVEQRKDKKRAKSNVESLIEDENTASKRGEYEYKELYDQDPRLAALQSAKDMVSFIESGGLEEMSIRRGESPEEAKKDAESSIKVNKQDIADLQADLEANPVVSSKTQEEVAPAVVLLSNDLKDVESTTKALDDSNFTNEVVEQIEELYLKENGNYKLWFTKIADKLFLKSKGLNPEEKLTKSLLERKGINPASFNEERNLFIKNNEKRILSEAYHKSKSDGSNPELVSAVENLVSLKTQEAAPATEAVLEVEQYEPITEKQVSHEKKFNKNTAIDYEEDTRETDSGREVTYLSRVTVEALDDNSGDAIGGLTKIVDEDKNVSWQALDLDGNELGKEDFDSLEEAKAALVKHWNKIQKKEFDKEAKRKAKAAEKEAAKKAKATEKNTKLAKDGKVQPQPTGDRTGRTESSTITPLEGAPSVPGVNGPDPQLVAVAEQYAKTNGIPFKRQAEYVKVDEKRAKRIADAYEAMANDPQNPKVKEAYQNLIKQTIAQYKALADAGYKFWFMDLNVPSNAEYASTPYNAIRDLRKNKEMGVFPTTDGYGDGGLTELDVENNPMLADTGLQWPVGGLDGEMKTVLANDLFRAVHDAFGHGLEGAGFRARGEENAWQAHVRLFTGSAIAAITSETRGQNSWLNYGPNGEQNKTAKVEDTVFAEQKVGLMPKWTWTEGRAADMEPAPPKEKRKAEPIVEEEGPTVEDLSGIDALLDLDVEDEDNMLRVLNALDRTDKAISKTLRGSANDALLAIPLSTIQLVVKSLKVLVKGGMMLRDAIKKVATDNSISQQIVKDILNVSEIQEGFDALMVKVDEMIARQTRRGTPEARMVSNIDTLVRNSEVYQNANDAQKKILEREARARAGVSARRAPSIGRILGVLKDITNVSREDKLKIISKIRQLSKDAAKDLATEIKSLAKEGKITANQAANIVARFGKVNMLSEISVSKFVDYMTKVFNDAEYNSKLSSAKSTKKDIAKLSKNKDKDANLRDLGKEFVKIDPSMVEDIDAYNEMASKIKEAIKGSTIRGQKVSFANTVNIDNATEYINKTLDVQDKMMRAEKADEIQSLMGIDVSDFSYEDMMMLLESDKPITKYNEGIIRDTINRAFGIYSSIIKDAIRTGKDPFTGEDVKFTESQKDVVERFMKMDLNVLSPKEALQAVDALANFLQNQSTARMESVVSQYNGIVGTKELKAKGIKAFELKKYGSKLLARFLGEQTTNLNVLFERMFKGFTAGGMVMDKMGLTKLINKKSAAQTEANRIVDRFVNLFYDKKANGEAFNSSYNNTERGMAAFMMRNVIGTEQEMKAEFDRRKGLIKESITQLEKGNDKEKAKAELYKKAYENILADSNTIEDVVKKVDKVNLEGINFWLDEWNNKYDQLSEVSENVYNKKLDKDINYTPDRFFTISSDTGTVEISNSESAFLVNSGTNDLYQRETGVLMEAVRPDSLPKGRYIDLSFDNNNANSMYDALVDINTAAPIRQIEAFLNSPDFDSVFPNSDDAEIIKGAKGRPGRIDMYIRNIRNKNPYSNDELASAVKKLNKIAAIGVGQALGGFTQPFKQVIPVMLNTLVNAKGKLDLSATFNKAKNDFINNSGYSIANRGIESQAQVESLNRLVEEVSKSKGEKLLNGIEKLNKKFLDIFLVKPDVFIARASWLTYYEKYLKDNGLYETTVETKTPSGTLEVTTKGIDYSTHKLNEDAANYAQRMVDRQQNVSDSDLAGKLFSSRDSSTQLLVKTVMPFASFRMNQASRLGADLATLTNKTSSSEDKSIAAMSLAGFGVEVATFRLVSIGISILLGSLAKAIMGIDEDDEEYEKRVDNIIKGARTGTFTDIFSPLPILDKPIQELGAFVTQNIEDATELPVAIYSPKSTEYFEGLGLFGISYERASQLAEIIKLSVTGEYTDDFGKKKTISSDAQDGLKMLIVPALMTNVGLAPSEVNSIVRYGIKDSKKSRKSSQEKAEKAERKQDTEDAKQQKIDAFENVKQETSDPEVLNAINEKIKELRATSEQKKQIQKKNKAERVLKQRLLVDPQTGEEYDTEAELKRYNEELWEKNFGEYSNWYKSHEAEKEATKLLNKEIRKMEDEEYNYVTPTRKPKRARNSDGTFKRKRREL